MRHDVLFFCFLSLSTIGVATSAQQKDSTPKSIDDHLIGHWKLAGDAQDSSSNANHGKVHNVEFTNGPTGAAKSAALFNGRDSSIEIPDAKSLHLGKSDFSVSVWVKPEAKMSGIFGDIVSKFDAPKRRGINFHIAGSSSGYSSMSDTRHVHFGIDDAYLGEWQDCGKPWPSNTLITNLVVFEGSLYAGIADAEKPEDACKVFRFEPATKKWIDCGRLGNAPNHLSVQSLLVHEGKLYAGTGIWYWSQAWGAIEGKQRAAKPRVFVYEGGTKWRDLGQLGDATRVIAMASFNGDLYAGIDKFHDANRKIVPGRCFRYDPKAKEGSQWIDCGAPDKRNIEGLMPFGGKLYCATHGNVYIYEGEKKWKMIANDPYDINQIHSIEAYRGKLHIGTWPQGYVLRYAGDKKWENTGRLGIEVAKAGEREINEINDLAIHNGKMYAGVIPLSEVYRYESDGNWTLLKSLGQQPKTTREDDSTWRRLTAMASFQGKLYAGTGSCHGSTENKDPGDTLGRVYSVEAGHIVSHEHDIGHDWTHIAVVRSGKELKLYINGKLSTSSNNSADREFDLTNTEPMLIGLGAQNYFTGGIADLRLYNKALDANAVQQLWGEKSDRVMRQLRQCELLQLSTDVSILCGFWLFFVHNEF